MKEINKKIIPIMGQFVISLTGIFGSLFFSEVMKFPPCELCWYQRIFMYPIALIILTGLFLDSKDTNKFIFPFISIGLIFSIYHNLVYYKFIQVIVPCSESAPCTAEQLNYLGFVTIPLLSLFGFSALLVLNLLTIKLDSKKGSI